MTAFFDRLGLSAPLIQAPMAGAQDHRLAAAVSNAGALGSLPAAMLDATGLRTQLAALRQATRGPINVNFFCHRPPEPDAGREAAWREALAPFYRELGLEVVPAGGPGRSPFSAEAAEVLAEFKPEVVSFHFGLPTPELLDRVKGLGSLVVSSATTVDEALWLQAQGVDAVIAQGLEAGGHRGMFLSDDLSTQLGTFALLPQVVAAVQLPVIAAGGIADAAGVAAARALGAAGVQVGTSYLCTPEALTGPLHRAALRSAAARHTALTNLFSGRPARGIVNRLMRELGPLSDRAPAFPLATAAVAPLRAAAEARGLDGFTPLWSGQNASGVRELPAEAITRGFIDAWNAAG
ncbi:nitronate monooxygenase [Ramlibacter sp. AW1]|uniref:Nitronate monooxygenase n=1 Tax=Ramlibacter aurantiacus TaxID=2801330 RepID=A0A936ZKU2_9BURK|nr:nitronate monooxygenase [Ramlibacter aurantiacus]MBL0421652.1 nitronate monooxygenase [Ramlibacter aurantiacus]